MARAARHGVGFDRAAWEALAADAEARRAALRDRLDALAPGRNLTGTTNWDSTEQVAAAFAGLGIALDATDDDTLAGIDHPRAALLREYRGPAKLATTSGRGWLRHLAPDGRVYPTWNRVGAGASGRMSCKVPNLQQLPRDPRYRRCPAAPGRVLVKADDSQIELRVAAMVSGDRRLLEVYRVGQDVQALTAAMILGKPAAEVTKADRQLANWGSDTSSGSTTSKRNG